ncbi:MAG: threonine aldolase, partial [Acidobacteria bacterium]|nr:threonine aldolase [Acidobacteriota bacterium]
NARTLAVGLAALPGILLDPYSVETNFLIFDVSGTELTSQEISARLKDHDVLANGIDPKTMRMVTHYDVDAAGIERALSAMRGILRR